MCRCSEAIRRTMRSFTLITSLLLCSLRRISVSGSESRTVEVRPGGEVTLTCSNVSRVQTHAFWSRIVNWTEISCVSSIFGSDGEARLCEGYTNGKFEASANVSAVSLTIKQVDLSDAGLYLCGFYKKTQTVMEAIRLNVEGGEAARDDADVPCEEQPSAGITRLSTVIPAALTVVLVMVIIGLLVRIRRLQTAPNEEGDPQRPDVGSDDLQYAALSFDSKTRRACRPAPRRELEPNVVYAATR